MTLAFEILIIVLLLIANLAILGINVKLYTEIQKLRVLRREE